MRRRERVAPTVSTGEGGKEGEIERGLGQGSLSTVSPVSTGKRGREGGRKEGREEGNGGGRGEREREKETWDRGASTVSTGNSISFATCAICT